MFRKKLLSELSIILILIFTFIHSSNAQYFGKNKVNYEVFDFKIYETPHFKIYHYIENEEELRNFARLCERWYDRHQRIFKDTLKKKNPVILYNNHADFQQTTVIQSLIGVGTGGVTEGYKERLIMPWAPSNKETNHVLGHEMVHVFQYNMFKNSDSLGLRSVGNVPLWMIEGLAEYLSIGRYDVKTAMWMRDAVAQDDIPTMKEMTRNMIDYFPYRYGHAFWAYFTGRYSDAAIRPLLLETGKSGYKRAMDSLLFIPADSLSKLWIEQIKQTHSPYLEGRQDSLGELAFGESNAGTMNIAPSVSPDGSKMIFISNKNVISTDFYLADLKEKKIIDRITKVVREAHIDNYSYLESAGSWSPDGEQFAITAFIKGENRLLIVDVDKEEIEQTIKFAELEAFNNPEWSPDGKKIVLAGLQKGKSDLYLYHMDTGELEQLTDDGYSDLQPSWAPDGSRIIFSTDRGDQTDQEQLTYGPYKIAEYYPETNTLNTLDILDEANLINPIYSPSGEEIYFVSDADGYRNIYQYSINNNVTKKVTDLKTGVSGITELSPCFDISAESEELVYILYSNDGYKIYKVDLTDLDGPVFTSDDVNFAASELVSFPEEALKDVVVDDLLESYPETEPQRFDMESYEGNFGLESIGTAGVGVGASRYGTGMAGGASFLFSDILRRHLLQTSIQIYGRIYDIAGQIFYLNQKNRFNWGVSFSHIPYRSSRSFLTLDTLDLPEEELVVQNLILIQRRTFEDELNIMGQYPISKKLRLEGGASATRYSFRIDSINNYYKGNLRIDRESQQIEAPDPFNLYRTYLAYAADNSQFGLTSPMRGYRYRIQVERTFGELNYWGFLNDYRKYFLLHPAAIGFRIMHYGRYGGDANELYPMFLGNEYFVRGYSYRSMSRAECSGEECLNVNNLSGSKMIVANAEFRYPLTGPKRLALIKSRTFFTDFVLFADGGLSWFNFDNIEFSWDPVEGEKHIPVFSAGAALRVNLFGALVLNGYYAYPYQRTKSKSGGVFGFYISAGF